MTTLQPPDQEELFVRALDEHRGAVERLVRSVERDPAARDDLFQDIALALWRAAPTFRGEASFRTFVLRIAHNRAASHVARAAARGRLLLDATDTRDDLHPGDESPERDAVEGEQRDRLERALQGLNWSLRQPVLLRLEGLAHAEIAALLGVSENAVAIRLTRAKNRLQDLLGASSRSSPASSASASEPASARASASTQETDP